MCIFVRKCPVRNPLGTGVGEMSQGNELGSDRGIVIKGTDQAGTFMSLKCVVYYANYRSGHQSSKIQVVP